MPMARTASVSSATGSSRVMSASGSTDPFIVAMRIRPGTWSGGITPGSTGVVHPRVASSSTMRR